EFGAVRAPSTTWEWMKRASADGAGRGPLRERPWLQPGRTGDWQKEHEDNRRTGLLGYYRRNGRLRVRPHRGRWVVPIADSVRFGSSWPVHSKVRNFGRTSAAAALASARPLRRWPQPRNQRPVTHRGRA